MLAQDKDNHACKEIPRVRRLAVGGFLLTGAVIGTLATICAPGPLRVGLRLLGGAYMCFIFYVGLAIIRGQRWAHWLLVVGIGCSGFLVLLLPLELAALEVVGLFLYMELIALVLYLFLKSRAKDGA